VSRFERLPGRWRAFAAMGCCKRSAGGAALAGSGATHYAPRARLVLIEGRLAELGHALAEAALDLVGERVGVMLPARLPRRLERRRWSNGGRWAAPEEMARGLYAGLRGAGRRGLHGDFVPAAAE